MLRRDWQGDRWIEPTLTGFLDTLDIAVYDNVGIRDLIPILSNGLLTPKIWSGARNFGRGHFVPVINGLMISNPSSSWPTSKAVTESLTFIYSFLGRGDLPGSLRRTADLDPFSHNDPDGIEVEEEKSSNVAGENPNTSSDTFDYCLVDQYWSPIRQYSTIGDGSSKFSTPSAHTMLQQAEQAGMDLMNIVR
ncbi:hypothetical protein NLJ89_g3535 [Agrocybe chaxingu]|uniref:Uncharacterized protein n=1 Tax=Agrocybe chaxingu TaxID=84603 RepID=A0A9W8K528_9AGAR|nr:hypothetical protein NLJ89_g3535 [Agrocybe chaxingu]